MGWAKKMGVGLVLCMLGCAESTFLPDAEPVLDDPVDDTVATCATGAWAGRWLGRDDRDLFDVALDLGADAEGGEASGALRLDIDDTRWCAYDLSCDPPEDTSVPRLALDLLPGGDVGCGEGYLWLRETDQGFLRADWAEGADGTGATNGYTLDREG